MRRLTDEVNRVCNEMNRIKEEMAQMWKLKDKKVRRPTL